MITPIPNQPIRLRSQNEISDSCDCVGQSYCQLIGQFDATQFQIKSSNIVSNGEFETDLDGWEVYEAITLELVSLTNASEDTCDGAFTVSASGGTGPYTYSIDGTNFQVSGTFAGLCPDDYFVIAKDANDNEGSLVVSLYENVDCSLYAGATIQDLVDDGILLGQLYNCTLGDLQ